jgi:small subunit ribosomal protein S3
MEDKEEHAYGSRPSFQSFRWEGVAETSTIQRATQPGGLRRSLLEEKRIRSRIAFFVESSTSELASSDKTLTHFIRPAYPVSAVRTKTIRLFYPFFGATFFFPRDGVYNLLFEDARESLLGKLRIKCWNLMAKDKKLIAKFIDLGIEVLIKGIELMIEIILNRRIPYGYNFYLNEVQKMRSLLSNRTKTNTLMESVKIQDVYQSASPIAQDISFQPKNKRAFRSIFRIIVKDIQFGIKKGIEGIRICCSGRLAGAEIAKTECGKYGKTSCNVLFNKQIDYASAEVNTRYGILGVKVWISYRKNTWGRGAII